MFIPDASQLRGLSYGKATLFGKPSVGSHYTSVSSGRYKLNRFAECTICGSVAESSHHIVPKGVMKRFTLKTPRGQFKLRSPLFALCGGGTAGCHGKMQHGLIRVRWEWVDPELEECWWNGEILTGHCEPGSEKLFELGHYVLSHNGDDFMEVRNVPNG